MISRPAGKYLLREATKKDSQDICFIPDKDYGAFLNDFVGDSSKNAFKPGNFVDVSGKVLGKHKGLAYYTYGQRRGLGVAAKTRLCVVEMRPGSNEIVLAEDEKAYSSKLVCSNMNWMSDEIKNPTRAWIKIRYAHKGEFGTIYQDGDRYIVEFENPVRAITPGQPVVFYDGDYVLGAGIIDGTLE